MIKTLLFVLSFLFWFLFLYLALHAIFIAPQWGTFEGVLVRDKYTILKHRRDVLSLDTTEEFLLKRLKGGSPMKMIFSTSYKPDLNDTSYLSAANEFSEGCFQFTEDSFTDSYFVEKKGIGNYQLMRIVISPDNQHIYVWRGLL